MGSLDKGVCTRWIAVGRRLVPPDGMRVATRGRGVTLIELLIVVTILAVLLGLAAPNLREFFVSNQLSSSSNELVTALATARNEAIRRATNVVLSNNNGASANWGSGWRMCADVNRNSACASTEETIRVSPPAASRTTIYTTFATGVVVFDAQGRVTSTPGVFVVCYDSAAFQQSGRTRSRAVQFNAAGKIRVALDSDGNGVPNVEKTDGTEVNIGTNCLGPTIP